MIKLGKQDVLLFQGDSITHGNRVESNWDMNHVLGHGYQFILAGKIGLDNYKTCPKIVNRGISGDTILKIFARSDTDVLDVHPTVFSILTGVNDCECAYGGVHTLPDVGAYERYYRKLLDKALAQNGSLKLIMCEPFRFMSPKAEAGTEFYAKNEWCVKYTPEYAAAVRKIAHDYGAVFVPFAEEMKKYVDESGKADYVVWDGIHPTYIGHEIMARVWYDAVDKSGILA